MLAPNAACMLGDWPCTQRGGWLGAWAQLQAPSVFLLASCAPRPAEGAHLPLPLRHLNPLGCPRYFSVSAQRGKDLGPIDVLKGCMFDSAVMPEALQVWLTSLSRLFPLCLCSVHAAASSQCDTARHLRPAQQQKLAPISQHANPRPAHRPRSPLSRHPFFLQDAYGKRWGELERLEGVGREGISYVCGLLAAIHLKPERGRRSEFEMPQASNLVSRA